MSEISLKDLFHASKLKKLDRHRLLRFHERE